MELNDNNKTKHELILEGIVGVNNNLIHIDDSLKKKYDRNSAYIKYIDNMLCESMDKYYSIVKNLQGIHSLSPQIPNPVIRSVENLDINQNIKKEIDIPMDTHIDMNNDDNDSDNISIHN